MLSACGLSPGHATAAARQAGAVWLWCRTQRRRQVMGRDCGGGGISQLRLCVGGAGVADEMKVYEGSKGHAERVWCGMQRRCQVERDQSWDRPPRTMQPVSSPLCTNDLPVPALWPCTIHQVQIAPASAYPSNHLNLGNFHSPPCACPLYVSAGPAQPPPQARPPTPSPAAGADQQLHRQEPPSFSTPQLPP